MASLRLLLVRLQGLLQQRLAPSLTFVCCCSYDLDGNGVIERPELYALLYNLPAHLWLGPPDSIANSITRSGKTPGVPAAPLGAPLGALSSEPWKLTDTEKKRIVEEIVDSVFTFKGTTFKQQQQPEQQRQQQQLLTPAVPRRRKSDTVVRGLLSPRLTHERRTAPASAATAAAAAAAEAGGLTYEDFLRVSASMPQLTAVGLQLCSCHSDTATAVSAVAVLTVLGFYLCGCILLRLLLLLLQLLQLFDNHALRPLLAHYKGLQDSLFSPPTPCG